MVTKDLSLGSEKILKGAFGFVYLNRFGDMIEFFPYVKVEGIPANARPIFLLQIIYEFADHFKLISRSDIEWQEAKIFG